MKKCLVVYSDYYKSISKNLLKGCISILKKNKINHDVYLVDGSYEIPQLINIKIKTKKYNSAIALGCVIKGKTPHFDFISKAITGAIMQLSIKYNLPISNGVLTCNNQAQAKIRSSGKKNKGIEAANALISVLKNLK